MLSDGQLLRRYVDEGSQSAFTELVQRHVNLVYHAALRRVGRNAHSADDVTQKVFSQLARKAKSLQDHPNLVGWLYTSTRFAAADSVRGERRRRVHEREAHLMSELDSTSPDARHLESFLDEAMDLLDERDREAVLLHFFKGLSFVEVGAALSLSADAARMRVSRALSRLRADLAKRGVASSATVLTAVLSTQSTIAAPAPLALAVANGALRHAQAAPSAAAELLRHAAIALQVTGLIVMITAIILIHPVLPRKPTQTGPKGPPEGLIPVKEASANSGPRLDSDLGRNEEIGPRAAASPAVTHFGQLSPGEKNLLVRLWRLHANGPPAPGYRWVLRVGPLAPNFDGCDPLLAKGWIKAGAKDWTISLTRAGAAFCAAHQKEIEAYSPATGSAVLKR